MRLSARVLLTVTTALIGLVAFGVAPAVAQTWSVQPTPNPVVPTGALLGVSCTSAASCIGVGYTSNSAGTDVTLAEIWNGATWTAQSTPNPAGAVYSFLSGVSCASATACTAVGYYGNSAGTELTLAESWNGIAWSIQSTPTPTGATYSDLQGVACTSGTACTAVGNFGLKNGGQSPLAEAWNGTSWSVQSPPAPSGATFSSLSGVSCTATACTAVGNYFNKSGTELTLAERLSGTTWSVQSTPNASGATLSNLSGVSCPSATACTAVGDYYNSAGNDVTLAESWNGSTWSIQATPNPTGSALSALTAISCMSATACTAVGSSHNSSNTQLTLAEAWNGTAWSIQSTPNPTGATSSSSLGVACVAATGGCFSAGYSTNAGGTRAPLAIGYFGPVYGWVIVSAPPPLGAAGSYLFGVSCASSTACMAVGRSLNSSGAQIPVAESWNGISWSIQPTPVPSGARAGSLSGVSCGSPTACIAVGSYVNSSGTMVTLAEGWNGTAWSVQSTPNPTGATSSSLAGVSCLSPTSCTAVGNAVTSAEGTLAEAWNGTSWSIQATRNPSGAKASTLSAVSCVAATGGCMAVGNTVNSAGTRVTLAEGYYGPVYGWLIVSTPNPTGATSSSLSSVSCPSSSSCTAVGSYNNGTTTLSMAEGWNGSSWSVQSFPSPSGATLALSNGVSCTASTACTAVGLYVNSSGVTVPLAEGWNGSSWSVQTTTNPLIATASVFYADSCTAATTCTAVGRYDNGVPLTLAEAD